MASSNEAYTRSYKAAEEFPWPTLLRHLFWDWELLDEQCRHSEAPLLFAPHGETTDSLKLWQLFQLPAVGSPNPGATRAREGASR